MVVYTSKRSWMDFLWFLAIFIPVMLGASIFGVDRKSDSIVNVVVLTGTGLFLILMFVLQEIFWKKDYKLELEKGMIREIYGKNVKEVKFKSLDLLDGTETPGSGTSQSYFIYPEFHLTLSDGSKQVFSARLITKLSSVVKAVKEVYPETKISKFVEESLKVRFINH